MHYKAGRMLLSRKIQQLSLIWSRDHAKTTMAATAILHKFCYATRQSPEFIAWIGEAQEQAIDNVKWVMSHLESNRLIHKYYGDFTAKKRWTSKEFITNHGCRLMAKGTTQRLRGRKEGSTRFTGMVLDDFESELNTKTPEARSFIKDWVVSAVYPAIDMDKGGFLWCNGTIVHYDSFLNGIRRDYHEALKAKKPFAWDVLECPATEDGTLEGKPMWESRWSTEKLKQKYQFYLNTGRPSKFFQEYMNKVRAPGDEIFNEEDIKNAYYTGFLKWDEGRGSWYILIDEKKVYGNIYFGVDPATSTESNRDYSTIVVTLVTEEYDYYVINYFRERVLPMDLAEKIFEFYKLYKPVKRVNIETIAYQEMLRDYMWRESKKRGVFIPGLEKGIKGYGKTSKKDRLFEGLQPMFKMGAIHLKASQIEFLNELLAFPAKTGATDDILDGFWLSTQFTSGFQRIGGKIRKAVIRAKRIKYDWVTGKRK